jgi:thioredoxin 1
MHMASANVHTFTDANFDAEVLNSDQPVVVDFWAEWCMPCKMLGPTIDALAEDFHGKAKIGKLDIDSSRNAAAKYEVMMIPTILIFKGGKPVKKFVGVARKDDLATAIAEAASK